MNCAMGPACMFVCQSFGMNELGYLSQSPEGSSPHSQAPATCPYPEPDQPSSCLLSHFLIIRFNIIIPSTPRSSELSLSLRSPTKTKYATPLSPTHATCPNHLILLYLIPGNVGADEKQFALIYRVIEKDGRDCLSRFT